jgi:hypothetical protein
MAVEGLTPVADAAAPALEAWRVGPEDDLTWNGDRING